MARRRVAGMREIFGWPQSGRVFAWIVRNMHSCQTMEQLHVVDNMVCNAINHGYVSDALGMHLQRMLKAAYINHSLEYRVASCGDLRRCGGRPPSYLQALRP